MLCAGQHAQDEPDGAIGIRPDSDSDSEGREAAAFGQTPRGAHALGPVVFAQLQAKSSAAGSDLQDGTATDADGDPPAVVDDDGSAAGSDDSSESEKEGPGLSPRVFAPIANNKSIHYWKRLGKVGHPLVFARVPGRKQRVRVVTARRAMWECAAMTFHPDVLVQKWNSLSRDLQNQQARALQVVFQFWGSAVFEVPRGDATTFKDPPPEMFEPMDFNRFRQQYEKLRDSFLPDLLQGEGAQLWVVERALIQIHGRVAPVSIENVAFCNESSLEKVWNGADFSIMFGRASAVGRQVWVSLRTPIAKIADRSAECIVGTVVGFEKYMPEPALYKLLMSRSYREEVSPAGLWGVLRMEHRLVMAGQTTEQLAESVGSYLTQRVKTQQGTHRALAHSIGGTRLQCFGIRGDRDDVGFVERCLNIYFRGKPWHFILERKAKERQAHMHMLGPSMALHNHRLKVVVARRFSWLTGPLRDVAASCGRRNLITPGQDHASLSTPRAGLVLKESKGSIEMLAKLAQASDALEPARMDERLRGGFGSVSAEGSAGHLG